MKLVHVVNVRWFNATAWYGLYLARLQMEAGHDVRVIVLLDTDTHRKAEEWGLPVDLELSSLISSANPLRHIQLFKKTAEFVLKFRPDIVTCHRGEAFLLWGLVRNWFPTFKLIRTRGDQRPPKNNLPNRWLHKSAADAVIATCSSIAQGLSNRLGLPMDSIHIIRGGVDKDKFQFDWQGRERIREEYGFTEHQVVIGLLGRLDPVKGHRTLIQALAKLRADGHDSIRLMFIGNQSRITAEELSGWARLDGVDDLTVHTGFHPDVRACISALDLGVVASNGSETIARAALEIMACGRPLIGSDVGVMPDILDRETLFPSDSSQRLADLIASLLPTEKRSELALKQKERLKEFAPSEFLARTENVYRSLLK